jgi:ribosomal protein S18 acetylase RimI-like enzyme
LELFSPATRDEAVALVASQPPTFAVESMVKRFSARSLEALFGRDARRPDLVWAARENGQLLGLLGARAMADDFGLVDLVALPAAPEAAGAVVGAATDWARTLGHAEASFGAPASEHPLEEPAVRAVVDAFAAHGWRVLITRRHYEFEPTPGLGEGTALPARLERAAATDRDRLEALVRKVLPGSLDVRDQANVAEHGLDAAATELTDGLLDDDPIDCVRFAVVDGEDAGFAVYRVMPSGSGYVAHVGVAATHRGRGLARGLVATASRDLVADGARVLVAGTDDVNVPMARAFAAVGWQQTESRIDLTLG